MSGTVPESPLSESAKPPVPETRHLKPDRTIWYRMAKWAQPFLCSKRSG